MTDDRITIRKVDPRAMDELRMVARHTGMTVGEAVSQALTFWLSSLPVGIIPADQQPRR